MNTIGWLFNFVPWWVPWLLAGLALVVTMNFWLPLWQLVPTKAKIAIGAVAAGVTAWWIGRNQGAKSERDQLKKREAGAVKQREKIDAEVHKLPQDDLDRRLHRWDRPDT